MTEPIFKFSTPEKKQIASAFGLKSISYDSSAVVQKELLSRLKILITDNSNDLWADLGCGTGYLEQLISSSEFSFRILGIDIAFKSLNYFQSRQIADTIAVNADIENLPFKKNSIDGIIIASVIQWFTDPESVLRSISEILKKNGTLLFAAFVNDSFWELNQLKQDWGLKIPVHLPDCKKFLDFVKKSGFSIKETDVYESTIYFQSAFELLKSISAIGGTATSGKRLKRYSLMKFCDDYEKRYGSDKGIPITYKAVIGKAIKESTDEKCCG